MSSSAVVPASVTLGFLSISQDGKENPGVYGGYLLTNSWGRPLEFRVTSAVQPTKVQQILYGPTLVEFLHGELIGKNLIEKSSVPPSLIVTDSLHALTLQSRLNLPVVAILPNQPENHGYCQKQHPRCKHPLWQLDAIAHGWPEVQKILDAIDPAVELSEPFCRVREALQEARKGVNSRAA